MAEGRSQAEVARELIAAGGVEGGPEDGVPPITIVRTSSAESPGAGVDDTTKKAETGKSVEPIVGEDTEVGTKTEESGDIITDVTESDSGAITKIQSQIRGRNARKELEQQNKAAAGVQAQFRGKLARGQVDDMKAKREASLSRAAEKHSPRVSVSTKERRA